MSIDNNNASLTTLDSNSFSTVIRPQDDLFRFVNGPWIDTYTLPDDRASYGAFHKLAEDAEEQIRDILESDDCAAIKSQRLYRSYLDTEAIQAAGIKPIKAKLDMVDQATSKEALLVTLGHLKPFGAMSPMFIMFVEPDPAEPTTNVVHIEQGGLSLPDEAYYREEHYEPIRQAFTMMVAKLLRLAGYADATTSQRDAERLLAIETQLAHHHWNNVDTRDTQKTHNPTSFEDLCKMLNNLDLSAWLQACQEAYDATSCAQRQHVNIREALANTIVREPSFLTGANEFWEQSDLDDLKLWVRTHMIIDAASLLSTDFDEAFFEFYGKTLSGAPQQRDRWKRGIGLVDNACGEEIGREYVAKHFPESSKAYMQRLVDDLITAYRVSITDSDWLGETTKQKALEKLAKFTPNIGYTNHWRDYSALEIQENNTLMENMNAVYLYEFGYEFSKVGKPVDREAWEMTPQTVNAYYHPTLNVIVFPAAILQPPFFNPQADDAINYGAIGAVIGHEIGHGFDDQGSQYDGDGVLRDWWTQEDKANFTERTKQLIEQYNAFVPTQIAKKYADVEDAKVPHVNGALTIGENIGDLSGVTIALKAYAFALQRAAGQPIDSSPEGIKATLEHAPTRDGYTGLQRFFLSYALIWRTKMRNELAEQYLQIDPHSPAECRTNGIARNIDLFYEAFNVNQQDAMWLDPDQRVHIW